jgi:hypothetical protein
MLWANFLQMSGAAEHLGLQCAGLNAQFICAFFVAICRKNCSEFIA